MIYLDNNATTAIASEVFEAMKPYFTEKFWNPSSMYDPAIALARDIAAARKSIAAHLGVKTATPILFTSCATESNNTAILGAVRANPDRKHIITSKVEHPAVLEVCRDLERRGYSISWIDVDTDGNLDLKQYVHALRPKETLLISIMHANNETGVIFPVERLARIAKETDPDILFHADATQSVSKLPIDLSGSFSNVDLLSFSGHKFHAPKGVGALYVRPGTPIRPYLIGGHQENGRRGGTENVPYIIGMACALDLAAETHEEDFARMLRLRDRLQKGIEEAVPFVEINGKNAKRMPNTLNVAAHSVEGESLLMLMNQEGIAVSSGSACTSGSLEPSHVLVAMKVPSSALQGSIRFSLSRYTTEEEIDKAIAAFKRSVENVRSASPYWNKTEHKPDFSKYFKNESI
ncbi:MAG: aminotransferase class V-fold PLP-dependent enzyme [Planctomycetia bacterium]|nr:aminotransferase class V-fold PLP-dependent enzyme [Planctomycetia bacterium]